MNRTIFSIFLPLITLFLAYYIDDTFFDVSCSEAECYQWFLDGKQGLNVSAFDLKYTGVIWLIALVVIMAELLFIWRKDSKK